MPKKNQEEEPRQSVWKELHEQAEKYQRMKFDRETDAIEWTKAPEEFTFRPEILGDKRAGKKMPLFYEHKATLRKTQDNGRPLNASDLENEGDEDAKLNNSISTDKNDSETPPEDGNQEQAVVCIDIKLGNEKHRITLAADSDPQQLADEFAQKHSLDEALKVKLTEQLEQNLKLHF